MAVQARIAGAGIAVGEQGGDETVGVDLGDALGAGAGECGVGLQVLQRIGHGLVVGGFDAFGHLDRRDRPQRRHRFHRGEGEVVSGDGGGELAAAAGNETAQLPRVQRWPPVPFLEHLPRDGGAHRRALVVGDGGIPSPPQAQVVVAVGHRQPLLKLGVTIIDQERPTEFGGIDGWPFGQSVDGDEMFDNNGGVGVQAQPKQRLHLVLGDLRTLGDSPHVLLDVSGQLPPGRGAERGQASADPAAGRFTLGGVVVAEAGAALVAVGSGGLPDQVHVPIPGGELVCAHHDRVTSQGRISVFVAGIGLKTGDWEFRVIES